MILVIDTSEAEAQLRLLDTHFNELDSLVWVSRLNQSEELLAKIEDFLASNSMTKIDLKSLIVNPGPGSYTGLRVGLTTANFLAFSLNIPIFSTAQSSKILSLKHLPTSFIQPVLPVYGKEPYITKPKPKTGRE